MCSLVGLFFSAWFILASGESDIMCGTGQYRSGASCLDCNEHCISCSNTDMCYECEERWYGPLCKQPCSLCKDEKCSKTGCELGCKDGFTSANYVFYNATFGKWCKTCDELWPSCFSCNPERCLRCYLRKWGQNCTQDCLQICEDGTCSIDTGKCDRQCQEGHYRNEMGRCKPCPAACQSNASSRSGNTSSTGWNVSTPVTISLILSVLLNLVLVCYILKDRLQKCCTKIPGHNTKPPYSIVSTNVCPATDNSAKEDQSVPVDDNHSTSSGTRV